MLAPASHRTARAAVERDVVGGTIGGARRAVQHTAALLVGVTVVAGIFADLARTWVTPARVPDAWPSEAPKE